MRAYARARVCVCVCVYTRTCVEKCGREKARVDRCSVGTCSVYVTLETFSFLLPLNFLSPPFVVFPSIADISVSFATNAKRTLAVDYPFFSLNDRGERFATRIHAHAHADTRTHVRTHARTCIRTQIRGKPHAHARQNEKESDRERQSDISIYIYTCVYIYMYIYIYRCMYIYI